jgi:hypothetical protein
MANQITQTGTPYYTYRELNQRTRLQNSYTTHTETSIIHSPSVYIQYKTPTHLIVDLKDIPVDSYLSSASFDITNMYFNLPTADLISLIAQSCDRQGLPLNLKLDILTLSNILIKQNYLCYQNTTYIQTEGLAMETPTSSFFSEITYSILKLPK